MEVRRTHTYPPSPLPHLQHTRDIPLESLIHKSRQQYYDALKMYETDTGIHLPITDL